MPKFPFWASPMDYLASVFHPFGRKEVNNMHYFVIWNYVGSLQFLYCIGVEDNGALCDIRIKISGWFITLMKI